MFFHMTLGVEKLGKIDGSLFEYEDPSLTSIELMSSQGPSAPLSRRAIADYYACCGHPEIIEYQGTLVCRNCAIVHEPALREGFNNDSKSRHTELTSSSNFYDYGPRTTFHLENLAAEKRSLFYRLAKLNSYYTNSIEANKKEANQYLLKISSQLEIPKSIYEFTLNIYQKVLSARMTTGRSIRQLMVGSLYLSCRLNKFSCHIDDFVRVTQIPDKIIRKNYHLIASTFNIKITRFSATNYISQFCTNLELPSTFFSTAIKLYNLVKDTNIPTGSNPRALASAIIYLTAKKVFKINEINQKCLAEVSNISEVTIRKYIHPIAGNLDFKNLRL